MPTWLELGPLVQLLGGGGLAAAAVVGFRMLSGVYDRAGAERENAAADAAAYRQAAVDDVVQIYRAALEAETARADREADRNAKLVRWANGRYRDGAEDTGEQLDD